MTPNSMSNQPDIPSTPQIDDEIDLRQVFKALLRRKALIAKITAASVFLTGLYAFSRKPVWEGQFEIVGDQLAYLKPAHCSSNPGLADLIGVTGGNNELETEVEILKAHQS